MHRTRRQTTIELQGRWMLHTTQAPGSLDLYTLHNTPMSQWADWRWDEYERTGDTLYPEGETRVIFCD
jgi:hypothetical protein